MDEHERFAFAEDAPLHQAAVGEGDLAVLGESVESFDVGAGFGVIHGCGASEDGAMRLRSLAGAADRTNAE